jgi:hypothetical protein
MAQKIPAKSGKPAFDLRKRAANKSAAPIRGGKRVIDVFGELGFETPAQLRKLAQHGHVESFKAGQEVHLTQNGFNTVRAFKRSLDLTRTADRVGVTKGVLSRWFDAGEFPQPLYGYAPKGWVRVPRSSLPAIRGRVKELKKDSADGRIIKRKMRGREVRRALRLERTTVGGFSKKSGLPEWFVRAGLNHKIIGGIYVAGGKGVGWKVFRNQEEPAKKAWAEYLSKVWHTTPEAHAEDHTARVRPLSEYLDELAKHGAGGNAARASTSIAKGGMFSVFARKGLGPGSSSKHIYVGGPMAAQLLKIAETHGQKGMKRAGYLWRSLRRSNKGDSVKAAQEWARISSGPDFMAWRTTPAPRQRAITPPAKKSKKPPAKPEVKPPSSGGQVMTTGEDRLAYMRRRWGNRPI